jgi:hypothetical protein
VIQGVFLVGELNSAVVVAMIAIWVVEVAIHQVVNVIAVGNCLMTAIRPVLVLGTMRSAVMAVGTVCGILCVDVEPMLVNMSVMQRVQVPIVKVVCVVIVNDRSMAAIFAMLMTMVLVDLVLIRH